MVEKSVQWIFPENLIKRQENERRKLKEGVKERVSFIGAYYLYRKGIDFDSIKHHALIDERKAMYYAESMQSYLQKYNLRICGKVLDVGCAVGTITNAIHKINKSGVTCGVDISIDAIEVAKSNYPLCKFFNQSADNLDNFGDGEFDIIHAREFYPFTRTNDADYHLKYLSLFCSKLGRGGFVVLEMADIGRGLGVTYGILANRLKCLGFSSMRRGVMIPIAFYKLFPELTYKNVAYEFISHLSKAMCRIVGVNSSYFYILTKS